MKVESIKQIKAFTNKSFIFIKGEEINAQAFALFFCESSQRYYFCAGIKGRLTTELLKEDKNLFRRTKKRDEYALSNYAFKVIEYYYA